MRYLFILLFSTWFLSTAQASSNVKLEREFDCEGKIESAEYSTLLTTNITAHMQDRFEALDLLDEEVAAMDWYTDLKVEGKNIFILASNSFDDDTEEYRDVSGRNQNIVLPVTETTLPCVPCHLKLSSEKEQRARRVRNYKLEVLLASETIASGTMVCQLK